MATVQQGWLVGHSPYTLWAETQGSGEEQIVGIFTGNGIPFQAVDGQEKTVP